MVDVAKGEASEIGSLALREGETPTLYVATANNPGLGFNDGGVLAALDGADGATRWSWDPVAAGLRGGVSGVALDVNGWAFVSVGGVTEAAGALVALDPDGEEAWRVTLDGNPGWGRPMVGDDGGVYLADWDDDCPLGRILPIEDAGCAEGSMSPRVYAVAGTSTATTPTSPDPACGCGTGAAGPAHGALAALLLGIRRRTRTPAPHPTSPLAISPDRNIL